VNWDRIERDWRHYKLSAKGRWDRLSENELKHINGKHDDLCAKIQQAYGISRHEAELQIADWTHELDEGAHGQRHESAQYQTQTLH
jgi:uncharacterized protein YjbJ (UPF0337 family)